MKLNTKLAEVKANRGRDIWSHKEIDFVMGNRERIGSLTRSWQRLRQIGDITMSILFFLRVFFKLYYEGNGMDSMLESSHISFLYFL